MPDEKSSGIINSMPPMMIARSKTGPVASRRALILMGATADGEVLNVPVWIILKPIRVGTVFAVEGQKFELVVTQRLKDDMNMFDPIKMGIKGEYNE